MRDLSAVGAAEDTNQVHAHASGSGAFGRSFDLLGDGSIRTVYTPGHTHGHMSVVLRLAGGREALVAGDATLPRGAEPHAAYLMNQLASYRQAVLAAYAQARPLHERALAIWEKALGPDHPGIARSLNNPRSQCAGR